MTPAANPKTSPKPQTSPHESRSRHGAARCNREAARPRRMTTGDASAQVVCNRPSVASADDPQAAPPASAPGWKRCLDIVCIVMSLPLILPLMLVILIWVKLVSRGPALLRQRRIGRNGRPFVLYKFRSMSVNSNTERQQAYVRSLVESDSPLIKLELICDSRLIAGGCLLRTAGLDELPQLLNVLRGEMSLVGPRPCLPGEYALFNPDQRERFDALPGLTGFWQVHGKNRSTFREMNAMDIHYVRNASMRMDLQIMMRTPAALLLQMLLAFQRQHAALRSVAFPQSGGGDGQEFPARRHRQLQ